MGPLNTAFTAALRHFFKKRGGQRPINHIVGPFTQYQL
jgi:hypothetical protein